MVTTYEAGEIRWCCNQHERKLNFLLVYLIELRLMSATCLKHFVEWMGSDRTTIHKGSLDHGRLHQGCQRSYRELVLPARDSCRIGIPVAICPEMVSCVFKEVEDGINRVVTFEGLSEGVDDEVYACLLSRTTQYQR
jgi:hypothetical protein